MELIKLTIDYVKVQYDPTTRPLTSYPDKLIKHLIKVHDFKKNQKLLEVGVGRPDMLLGFKRFGLNVQGCDKSVESMRICQKNDIPFKLVDFSQKKLPYKTGTFDIVYSKSVIEHMVDPLKFIMECRRVLKPGGKILTLTPDWNANYLTFFDDFTHVRPMTRRSMELILKVADFHKINVYRFRQLPSTWNSSILNRLSAVIGFFVHPNVRKPFFRWSRELMLVGYGSKPSIKGKN